MIRLNVLIFMIANCNALQIQLCTGIRPSNTCVRTVADTFNVLGRHEVETVNVNINKKNSNVKVVVDLMCKRGFRTMARGKGLTIQEACESSCKNAIKSVKKKKKHRINYEVEQCYLVHDLR